MPPLRYRAWHPDLYDGEMFTDFRLSSSGEVLFWDEIRGTWHLERIFD